MTAPTDPAQTLRAACDALLNGSKDQARELIRADYPFTGQPARPRQYTEIEKTRLFVRDGFIDRYTGKRLVFMGMLRLLSFLMPEEFPYNPNWKLDRCHIAYWDLSPTLDHIIPVTRGGLDQPDNWITTSMVSNAAKANWTLEELGWKVLPAGNLAEWDGLLGTFISLVESDSALLRQEYIRKYYRVATTVLGERH